MAEERLKRNLESAFDPGPDFPHRLWISRTMAALELENRAFQGRPRSTRPAWVMPAIALVLAVAIVSGLLSVSFMLHAKNSVPGKQVRSPRVSAPTPRLPSTVSSVDCFGYGLPRVGVVVGSTQYGSRGPIPIRMLSPTTIWAKGGLLTNNGGRHWHDTSPPALRQDEPTGLSKAYLPPSYTEFYLDADHAWMARAFNYGSQAVCYDHVVIFGTSDGGRSWQQSQPIAVQPRSLQGLFLNLLFTDAQHGLLWVGQVEPRLPGGPDFDLYATNDGGRTWRFISQANGVPGPCIGFVSPTVGWSAGCGLDETSASLETTHDGGVTWQAAELPVTRACTWYVGPAAFFDQLRAVTYVHENCTGTHLLLETSDGGTSWRRLNLPPGSVTAIGFFDAQNFWALMGPAVASKGTSPIPFSLYRSGDGGAMWTVFQQDAPIVLPINMQFVDANHGMLAEESSCTDTPSGCTMELRVTADGGRTWTLIHPEIS